ncbi:c-type cytochrome [Polyangium jinanense]|uniref:C-type cytochrome n=1 Tax=Polyangium jinanense TaxID=2829994 RepID=A0A9X3X0K9_9BACT|nr:c-type cytochrome [Polyangium jinanense]MDC3952400.1 c-type cytochrome [Polyangium jinanense]MDC3980028.1 c-type cytochrome [Polyangium jinanense]
MGGPKPRLRLALAITIASPLACSSPKDTPDASAPAPSASQAVAPPPSSAAPAQPLPLSPAERQGGVIARSRQGDALFVADEDHKVLRRIPLPLAPGASATELQLPGAPAQVLPIDGAVLVTIRDPGLLLVLKPDASGALTEASRVALPADAWGLAATADARHAFVTSAWMHTVSKVDLAAGKVVWSADVAREPRGIAVLGTGEILVSHLVGADVTHIGEASGAPVVKTIGVMPSPVRAPSGKKLHASLGYSLVTSPDEGRLFVARHAVGALARRSWFGQPTVDVVLLPGKNGRAAPEQLAATHVGGLPAQKSRVADLTMTADTPVSIPGRDKGPFTQPRAMVYRAKSDTLLVAGEGDDVVAELDAIALDPTLAIVRIFQVGQKYDPGYGAASECGAPSGITLSADEDTAYVFCRSTYDVVAIDLAAKAPVDPIVRDRQTLVHLADDTLSAEAQKGRRLFYNATDPILSGGLGCAGCHPDGRDDGHVWHEATFDTIDGLHTNFVGVYENVPDLAKTKGFPRRTPMLAGLVNAAGPYGWHGESPDLGARITAGMGLHRWGGMPQNIGGAAVGRASLVAAFVREGLVPPPRENRELTEKEKRGRELFTSDATKCARCHVPASHYTDRTPYPLKRLPPVSGFDDESKQEFKTPSLRFVAGRAPYFHDGRISTLEKLVELNGDRMGNTSQLSAEDREALVAFLKTL